MMEPFEMIGMGFCAGIGFLAGIIFLCWIGDAISYWWNNR
jgi:hypothetical protein